MASIQYPMSSEQALTLGCQDILERFGIRITVEESGRTYGELPLGDNVRNLYGLPDGGILFYLADCTAGIAFLSAGGNGVTASATVNFMRSADPDAGKLYCRGEVKKMGRTLCYVSAVITDEAGRELSEYNFIFCNRPQQDG